MFRGQRCYRDGMGEPTSSLRPCLGVLSTLAQLKELKRAYGFDDVAIAPGEITVNPEGVNTAFTLDGHEFKIPFLASAMDAVVNPAFAAELHRLGGLAVLNLDGLQTRYADTEEIYSDIASKPREEATAFLQKVYSQPVQDDLICRRVEEIKASGATCAVSVIPANTKRLAPMVKEAGAEILVVQSTVTTVKHISKSLRGLIFSELVESIGLPVLVGNTVSPEVTRQLMEQGVSGILVGVGPGAACTSREVLGIGVPQVTATIQTAFARDQYFEDTGRYVPIITAGGIRTGGDVCKSIAAGADAVMIGTPFAQPQEAPALGFHWGRASPNESLPRGVRVSVGGKGSLDKILFGPTSKTDGTQNLIGALEVCMGMVGAADIKGMHKADVVLAPSIKTEGKYFQLGLG